jgi:PAS domain S-box-containing protein
MSTVLLGLSVEVANAASRDLSSRGQSWISVASTAEALSSTDAQGPALALVGGASVESLLASVKALRANVTWRDTVLIAVVRDGNEVRAVLDAGADDFVIESLGEPALHGRIVVAERTAAGMLSRKLTEKDHDSFFDLCLDLLCVVGFDGYFKKVNPAWTRLLGWSAEELQSKPWLFFVHPDDVDVTIEAGGALVDGGALISYTNRYRCKDGSYRCLEWQATTSLDRSAIYGTVRDVTEARAARAQLRELSESLATTLYSIGDGVIATNVDGAIVRMNPVAEQLTGWTIAEAQQRPLADTMILLNEDTREPVENPFVRVLRDRVKIQLPEGTVIVRKDGSEVAIADSCTPIRMSDGTLSGAVLVFRDLTEERAAATIEAKYQQQLIVSDRMASIGTLAAGVAHEINNPLTYVTANVDLALGELQALAGGSTPERLQHVAALLADVREGASRIAKIVRGLKTYSRVEEERRVVFDLLPVLELSIDMAFNEIRHRGRVVKAYGKLPLVDGDDARLGQVFINLLVNAAQSLPTTHMEANEIRIVTSTDERGRAIVEVRDTGVGIPAAILSRVFDPFFTTKPIGVGTGLGLAICHNIVAGMGGELSVESEVGRGTTFRVALPGSSGVPSKLPDVATAAAGPLQPAQVLVIDDEPAIARAIGSVLRAHHVTLVTSAREALALFSAGKEFDVVLSDLMMPVMSGMELFDVLSKLNPKMASKVVFVTGGAFTPEANAFLDRVPNLRIEKPFASQALRDLVQTFTRSPA